MIGKFNSTAFFLSFLSFYLFICFSSDDDESNWQSVPFSLKSKQPLAQASQQQIRLNVKHAIDLRALPCWQFISDYDTAETVKHLFLILI